MWLITNRGFISAVAKDRKGIKSSPGPMGEVSIRGRRRGDLEALFPGEPIVETPKGDYRYRVFVSRMRLAQVVTDEALGLDYTNFKDSIPKTDNPLKQACMSLWHALGKLQPGGPYGWANRDPRQADWLDYRDSCSTVGRYPNGADPQESCDVCGHFFPAAGLKDGICTECTIDVAAAVGDPVVRVDAEGSVLEQCGGCELEFPPDDLATFRLCGECEDLMLDAVEAKYETVDMAGLFAGRHPATTVAE